MIVFFRAHYMDVLIGIYAMTVDHVGACQRKWSIIMLRLRAKEGASNGAQPSWQGNKAGRKERSSEPCNL